MLEGAGKHHPENGRRHAGDQRRMDKEEDPGGAGKGASGREIQASSRRTVGENLDSSTRPEGNDTGRKRRKRETGKGPGGTKMGQGGSGE